MKVFGRDPVVWAGLGTLLLTFLVTLNLPNLTNEHAGLITAAVAAVFGLYQAWATSNVSLAVATTAVKATLALAAGYKLSLTPDQTASLAALAAFGIDMYLRTQTSPVETPLNSA